MIIPAKFPVLNPNQITSDSNFTGNLGIDKALSSQNTEEQSVLYNPYQCTFEEFAATIKTLSNKGKLAEHELALATANFESCIKRSNSELTYYITPTDALGRRDWVVEFGALAQRELERGNILGFERNLERRDVAIKVGNMLMSNC